MLGITDQKMSRTKSEVAELKYRHTQLQEEFNKLSAELNSYVQIVETALKIFLLTTIHSDDLR